MRVLLTTLLFLVLAQSVFAAKFNSVSIIGAEPTQLEIKTIEAKLAAFISANTPEGREPITNIYQYKFQYAVIESGKRTIFINAVCQGFWPNVSSWDTQLVVVDDGGSCFFQLKYDPGTDWFFEFLINGDA